MSIFNQAQAFVEKWEGGYCCDKGDPGGATNHGLSYAFMRELPLWESDLNDDGVFDVKDIKDATAYDAARIFKRHFWDGNNLDKLEATHPLCAWVVYDTSVNMGSGVGRKLLQSSIGGIAVDGIWGPKTYAALSTCDDFQLAVLMLDSRRDRYEYLADHKKVYKRFLQGWLNRVDDLEKQIFIVKRTKI